MSGRDDETEVAAEIQRAYADAILAGLPGQAEALIRDAIEAGISEATLDDEVIGPALALVGDLWAEGRISVAEEHLATAISRHVLAILRDVFRTVRARTEHRVLLAGAEGELHVLGLEMASSLMLHAGYDVRMLGADLPVEEVGHAVRIHGPAVLGLTAATHETAAQLPAAFEAARAQDARIGIVVGGGAVHEAWATGFGVVVCRHVADAVDHVDALVRRAPHN